MKAFKRDLFEYVDYRWRLPGRKWHTVFKANSSSALCGMSRTSSSAVLALASSSFCFFFFLIRYSSNAWYAFSTSESSLPLTVLPPNRGASGIVATSVRDFLCSSRFLAIFESFELVILDELLSEICWRLSTPAQVFSSHPYLL